MTAPTRIGIVGYGFGGRVFHAPLVAAAAGCELVGVVTRSPARRAELAADAAGVPAYDDLATLAGTGVDAVTITTPLAAHADLVREALDLGLPVVCDKPFTADAATARALVEQAERAGVLLSVYQNRRWDADYLTVRRVVESGLLGDVEVFESRMEQAPPRGGYGWTGGGVRLDFGAHVVDQALRLFGPVESVVAETHTATTPAGFDSRWFGLLRHAGGVSSRITADWALHGGGGPRFRVQGRDAALVVAVDDDGQTARLQADRSAALTPDFGSVPEENWGRIWRGGAAAETVPAERGSWHRFYEGWGAAVRGEGPVPVDPRDAVAALEVLDAARESASSGVAVRLTPPAP